MGIANKPSSHPFALVPLLPPHHTSSLASPLSPASPAFSAAPCQFPLKIQLHLALSPLKHSIQLLSAIVALWTPPPLSPSWPLPQQSPGWPLMGPPCPWQPLLASNPLSSSACLPNHLTAILMPLPSMSCPSRIPLASSPFPQAPHPAHR